MHNSPFLKIAWIAVVALLALSACQDGLPQAPSETAVVLATQTSAPAFTASSTASTTATITPTLTPSASVTIPRTPTMTLTPTISATATITPTPTRAWPNAVIRMQANCRYGPDVDYLYSHGLYPGDRVEVNGRTYSGTWLWIQPANLDRHCWAAASVMEVSGDIMSVPVVTSKLPHTQKVGPPTKVKAVRSGKTGSKVTVSWQEVGFQTSEEHGYLLEVTHCQDGALVYEVLQTPENEITLVDEASCKGDSGGVVYAFEKHGYTDPVRIPWPGR